MIRYHVNGVQKRMSTSNNTFSEDLTGVCMFIEFVKLSLGKLTKCEPCLNDFNNTRARMLNSVYHMTPLDQHDLKSHFWLENVKILLSFTQHYNGRHYVTQLNL